MLKNLQKLMMLCLMLVGISMNANAWKFTVSSPAEGKVESLNQIVLNEPVGTMWVDEFGSMPCTLTGSNGITKTYNLGDNFSQQVAGSPSDFETITSDGTYTLTIPAGTFHIGGVGNDECRFTWFIGSGDPGAGGGDPEPEAPKYSLNVDAYIENGSVSVLGDLKQAKEGDDISLIATPADGYQFDSWNVTNASTGAVISVSYNQFAMPAANVNISATFRIATYEVIVNMPTGCSSMTATPNSNVVEGRTITLSQTPAAGYQFNGWDVWDANIRTVEVTNNQFTMPASNVTVTGTYSKINYTITMDAMTNGSVTCDHDKSTSGEAVSVTVNPIPGYKLQTLTVKNNSTNTNVPVTNNQFTMPAADVTISAIFVEASFPSYTFTYTPGSITIMWPSGTSVEPYLGGITIEGYSGFINPLLQNSLGAMGATNQIRIYGEFAEGDYTLVLPESSYYINGGVTREIRVPFSVGDVDIEISSALYATFVPSADVDISSNDDVEAYVVASMEDGYVSMAQVTQVPANNAVIVKANAAGTYSVERMSDADLGSTNLLQVSSGLDVNEENKYYILANGNIGVGFYPVKIDTSIPANKGYLEVAGGLASYRMSFGEATDIKGVVLNKLDGSREIYDLNGQRVNANAKGIVIMNGKKVLK